NFMHLQRMNAIATPGLPINPIETASTDEDDESKESKGLLTPDSSDNKWNFFSLEKLFNMMTLRSNEADMIHNTNPRDIELRMTNLTWIYYNNQSELAYEWYNPDDVRITVCYFTPVGIRTTYHYCESGSIDADRHRW